MSSRVAAGPASTSVERAPAAGIVLLRTCRAEWSRLCTVRSTWWFSLAAAVAVLGIATVLGIDVQGDPREMQPEGTAWRGGQISATFGFYVLLALCAVAVTADHGTGGIVPALQATPRRGILLTARAVVVTAFATVYGCVLVVGAGGIVYAFVPEMGLPVGTGLAVVGEVGFAYAASVLVAVGIGLLTRNTAGSLVAVLALMLVLPLMLGSLPFDWSRQLAELLPGTSALVLITGEAAVMVTEAAAYITLSLWAVVLLAAGGVRMLHTDASR